MQFHPALHPTLGYAKNPTLRRAVFSLAVVSVTVSVLTLLGCRVEEKTRNNNRTTSLPATTAANDTTAILNGGTFTVTATGIPVGSTTGTAGAEGDTLIFPTHHDFTFSAPFVTVGSVAATSDVNKRAFTSASGVVIDQALASVPITLPLTNTTERLEYVEGMTAGLARTSAMSTFGTLVCGSVTHALEARALGRVSSASCITMRSLALPITDTVATSSIPYGSSGLEKREA